MKCFDLRRKEAFRTYVTSSESVRDIKFSPHEVKSRGKKSNYVDNSEIAIIIIIVKVIKVNNHIR